MSAPRCLSELALILVLIFPALSAQQQTPDTTSSAYPELDDANVRKLVKGCSIPHKVSGPGTPGSQIVLQLTVSEKGKLLNVHALQGGFKHDLSVIMASCYFAPYKVSGVPTSFQGNVVIDVK